MEKNDRQLLATDFSTFMSASDSQVPRSLSALVLERVHKDLHPSPFRVFGKIVLTQFGVGSLTLLFCPQFGISLTSSHGVMPYLMKYGDGVCMLACGAIFTALSFLIASFALRPEEVRALKKHESLQLLSVATLSLGAFLCLGAEIVLTLGLIWLLGAIIGGAATLELGWMLRKQLVRRTA